MPAVSTAVLIRSEPKGENYDLSGCFFEQDLRAGTGRQPVLPDSTWSSQMRRPEEKEHSATSELNFLQRSLRLFSSSGFRHEYLRRGIKRKLERWEQNGQIGSEKARELAAQFERLQQSPYWKDMALTLALVPIGYAVNFTVYPALVAGGALEVAPALLISQFTGSMLRTLYSAARVLTSSAGQRPWTALAVGAVPQLGQSAYLMEILGRHESEREICRMLISNGRSAQDRKGRSGVTTH